MEQRSKEWFDARKGKLTASKAPIILGISPYQTPFELWEEELGLRDPKPQTAAMSLGLEIEDDAREYFLMQTGIETVPEVIFKDQHFMASLDGYNREHQVVLEIKRNNKDYHEMAKNGKVPDHHFCQIQHQLYCTGFDQCHYLSWGTDGTKYLVIVPKDAGYIAQMVEKELAFKKMLDTFVAPPLTERDYEDLTDDAELANDASLYKHYLSIQKEYENKAEFIKNRMLEKIGDRSAKGHGFKLTRYTVKGRLDYAKMIEKESLTEIAEKYRKESTVSYRLTVE